MSDSNHYETLRVSPNATQAEIKQAYRRLVKLFHPDSNRNIAGHEEISRVNTAYEILGDTQRRQSYDQQLYQPAFNNVQDRQQRSAKAQTQYQQHRQTGKDADEQLQQWLKQVYKPVNQMLCRILNPIEEQIDELAADPFDDDLIEAFQTYLNNCRDFLSYAQQCFRSMPNPAPVAGVAANLYYCLNQVGDGINELEYFTLNYNEHYLHTGHELFRIAIRLRREAQAALRNVV
jgi:molecular chaperone DnaJ